MLNESQRTDSKARRKESKAASDLKRRAARTELERRRRQANIAKGLTSRGKPRERKLVNPRTAALRPFLQDLVIRRTPDVAYNAPAQSVDEWLAQGNKQEFLPPPQYSIPRVIQVGARY